MNKLHKTLLALFAVAATSATAGDLDINDGKWSIIYNSADKTITYKYDGATIIDGAYIVVGNKPNPATLNDAVSSKDITSVTLTSESVSDNFGAGTKYTYKYRTIGAADLEQDIYIYDNYPYILTQTTAVSASDNDIKYNYIAAIKSETATTSILPADGDNRVFDMPFDNDSWHTFSAYKWSDVTGGNTSMEATAFYDVNSRKGIVIGTVDHDTWKTGAYVKTSGSNQIAELHVYGGYVGSRTWDVVSSGAPLTRHGYVSGQRVSSARVFIGVNDDWRTGLEEYGEANAIINPKRPWDGGTIFGWQSWGGMAHYLNYGGAAEVSDYFNTNLPHVKNEQGTVFMILDSYWDNLSSAELANFVRRCERNGQIPGVYYTPYTFWGSIDEVDTWETGIDGTVYADIVLRANGYPRKINGISIDPTHPVTKQKVRNQINTFKSLGFKYIKIDFMNNASLEADSYYDPNVTTGMQAYNEGLRYFAECCGDDMFINLSIAPVWPAHYAQGRRIGCDAWGEINQSQYTLNCMNLSWWLEKVYSFNDPDHVVYIDKGDTGSGFVYYNNWPLNYNRIRTTTGIMCGTMVLGDNFSLEKGTCKGIQDARDRAEDMMSVPEILDIARFGKMFRPVEGSLNYPFSTFASGYSDNLFILDTDNAWYVAIFNFDNGAAMKNTDLSFERLGVDGGNVNAITEVWRNSATTFTAEGFKASVPRQDVCVYKLDKIIAGVDDIVIDSNPLSIIVSEGEINVTAPERIKAVNLYSIDGRLQTSVAYSGESNMVTMSHNAQNGIYIVNVVMADGATTSQKIVIS